MDLWHSPSAFEDDMNGYWIARMITRATSHMMLPARALVWLFVSLTPSPGLSQAAKDGDPIYLFKDNNSAMNTAISDVRRSLDPFFTAMAGAPAGANGFLLKAALADGTDRHEHIWVENIRQTAPGEFSGNLSNQPHYTDGNRGDPVKFTQNDISDWMFRSGDKMHGTYTVRVILPQMSQEDRAKYTAILAPLPKDR
ncbi:YegJ family protein [Actibacterium sp. 188UL27-1]|uniref:YegJ family protein n=1 Tax=Actibacterium sp. 188UL27-1 TaxID=2786961 RepID=UPI00195659E1|nr:DUF2314 domain-containing protein [Actibacterium sp. 188UL27-1]MBM7068248.1 DUF2314 domain-containing protein [Actibacterium sp. 188UL27-1]